jgi:small-conductance mechanosensitive channel
VLLHEELSGAARWLVPLVLFGSVLALGIVLRLLLLRTLSRWASKTTSRLDDYVLVATRWPSMLWILIVALLAAFQTVHLPGAHADAVVGRALAALLILSITIGLARFLGELVQHYRSELAPELAIASTGLLRTFVQGAVLVTGLLVMLSTLGINIAPVLGALGVGGLAAGLALQPTLSNLFAGFQIAVARQVRVGQRVKLASGEDGYVTDISWRTTTLRTPANCIIIIPNSKFADSILTNFNLPDPPVNITLSISVGLEADPRRVEEALRDEARQAVAEMPLLVKSFDPLVRLQSFADAVLQFLVIFRVQDYDAQFDIWGELQQRLCARLTREGWPPAIPARAIYQYGERPESPAR